MIEIFVTKMLNFVYDVNLERKFSKMTMYHLDNVYVPVTKKQQNKQKNIA